MYRLVQNKRGKPDRGPRKRVLAVGALLAFIVGVVVTPAQDSETAGERKAATQGTTSAISPSSAPGEDGPTGPTGPAPKTIRDASELVDDDDFPAALAIAAVLGGEAERSDDHRGMLGVMSLVACAQRHVGGEVAERKLREAVAPRAPSWRSSPWMTPARA